MNMYRAKVLVAVQDKDFIQWPKPIKAEANKKDSDKYCQYHQNHDHDTNHCYQLMNKIERPPPEFHEKARGLETIIEHSWKKA